MTATVESNSYTAFQALSPSFKELEEFEARGRQILECETQVQFWKEKLDNLMRDQERYYRLARLRLNAQIEWDILSHTQKLEKENILAAFQSDDLPLVLSRFGVDDFPLNIRSDREIFLARVCRKDFGYYNNLRYSIGSLIASALCGDKEVMLECVQRNARFVECLTDDLKDDKDIFRAVLKTSPLIPKFLLPFSEEVRSDADLMLELFNHPDLFPCDNKPKTQVLRYASQRLRDDYDFVLKCVQKSGLNLRHASENLRRDPRIVAAACAESRRAIAYCLPEAIDEVEGIWEHRDIAVGAVTQDLGLAMECIERYNDDHEIISLALLNWEFGWDLIPEELQSNVDFIITALRLKPEKVWFSLPEEIQGDLRVGSEVFKNKSCSEELIWEVVQQCPDVLFSRECLKDFFLNHSHLTSVLEYIYGITDIDIWDDREIMLAAISKDRCHWDGCSDELRRDRDFMLELVETCPSVFEFVEEDWQMEHPEMALRALQKHPDYFRERFNDFCPELWLNKKVAMAWLEIGGRWPRYCFPEDFGDDEELVLIAIRNNWEDFHVVSDNLLKDKVFISKALAVNARIVEVMDPHTLDDEIFMAAISNDSCCIGFLLGSSEDHSTLISFAQKIRLRLREYWAFHHEVLSSIRIPSTEESECVLPMLNQGPATLATYIDNISSYVGMIDEGEIPTYIATSNHLAAWGL